MSATFSEADYKRFRDSLELCEQKLGGGKLGYDVRCTKNLIQSDPAGARSYFEFYLTAASVSALNHIKLAAIIAFGYLSVFEDATLVERLEAFARDPAVRAQIEAIEVMWGRPPRTH